ncbi:MAG: aldehyde dehydrogenase family protein [Hoeflea sp.]|uniref:aldehyde dehydrogenase family protein n=1 Tax=Hoeflea sp. TaxID=1940281 RepID=UPI003298FA15
MDLRNRLKWQVRMRENTENLARILTAEVGKPLAEARGETAYGASFIQWFAEEGRRICGDVIPGHQNDKRIIVLGLSSATPSSARQAKR